MGNLTQVLLQSLMAFAVLFIIAKLLGKKQVAQLEFTDYVIGISIGSIAAEMATVNDRPFYHFIVGMVVFGGLDLIITIASRKAHILKKIFIGRPLILISNGQIVYKNLLKSKLDVNELIALCRQKGFFNLQDIAYCVFENNGQISVLPQFYARPATSGDVQAPVQPVKLPAALVIDGKPMKKELVRLNKTNQWLYRRLKIKDKKQLKNVILATFDEGSNEINVYTKE